MNPDEFLVVSFLVICIALFILYLRDEIREIRELFRIKKKIEKNSLYGKMGKMGKMGSPVTAPPGPENRMYTTQQFEQNCLGNLDIKYVQGILKKMHPENFV
jgi:hypothetical protein